MVYKLKLYFTSAEGEKKIFNDKLILVKDNKYSECSIGGYVKELVTGRKINTGMSVVRPISFEDSLPYFNIDDLNPDNVATKEEMKQYKKDFDIKAFLDLAEQLEIPEYIVDYEAVKNDGKEIHEIDIDKHCKKTPLKLTFREKVLLKKAKIK